MIDTCIYEGSTPMDITMCNGCSLFMETCTPLANSEGYSNGECEAFLCESCRHNCHYKELMNI